MRVLRYVLRSGTSSLLLAAAFSTAAVGCACGDDLELTGIDPQRGPVSGGTAVLLLGEGFRQGMTARIGDSPPQEPQVLSEYVARLVTPAADEPGAVDVEITVLGSRLVLAGAFEYVSAPHITEVTPSWGPVSGGTSVMVRGSGFEEGDAVFFGSAEAQTARVDEETLSTVTPPGTAGEVPVRVVGAGGSATLEGAFRYLADTDCEVVTVLPGWNEGGVPVVETPRVAWSRPPSAPESIRATFGPVGEAPVDVTLEWEGDATLRVVPARPLRFWAAYALRVEQDARPGACEGLATSFRTIEPMEIPLAKRPAVASDVASVPGENIALTATGTGRSIQVWDRSGLRPTLVREVPLDGVSQGIAVEGDRAYVALGWDGVAILDLADATLPRVVGVAGTPGFASDVAAASEAGGERRLFVADGDEGVRILDVTDPEASRTLGQFLPGGERDVVASRLALDGSRLAVAGGGGYALWDVATPSAPTRAGEGAYGRRRPVGVSLEGDRMAVAFGRNGVALIDAGTPDLALLHVVDVDRDAIPSESFLDVRIEGADLWTTVARSGLRRYAIAEDGVLSLTEDAFPVPGSALSLTRAAHGGDLLVGSWAGLRVLRDEPDGVRALVGPLEASRGDAVDVATTGEGHAFVSAGLRGVLTYLVPGADEPPVWRATTDTPASLGADVAASNVLVEGDEVVVGDGRLGVSIYDAADPSAPVLLGSVLSQDRIRALVRREDTVFSCEDNFGIQVVDVSDPSSPRVLASESFPDEFADQCLDVDLLDETLYVGSRRGLTILDVASPEAPRTLGFFPLRAEDTVRSISASGAFLVATTSVADFEGEDGLLRRLQVFDVSEPAAPARVYVSADLGGGSDVLLLQSLAFVAGDEGVLVFDLERPDQPRLQGMVPIGSSTSRLAAAADQLLVAGRYGGLRAVRTGALPGR